MLGAVVCAGQDDQVARVVVVRVVIQVVDLDAVGQDHAVEHAVLVDPHVPSVAVRPVQVGVSLHALAAWLPFRDAFTANESP